MSWFSKLFGGATGEGEKKPDRPKTPAETEADIQAAKARLGSTLSADTTAWSTLWPQAEKNGTVATALAELVFERLQGRKPDVAEKLLFYGMMMNRGPVPVPPPTRTTLYNGIFLSQFQFALVLADSFRGLVLFSQQQRVGAFATHTLGDMSVLDAMKLVGARPYVLESQTPDPGSLVDQKKTLVVSDWGRIQGCRDVRTSPAMCVYASQKGVWASLDMGIMNLERFLNSNRDWTT